MAGREDVADIVEPGESRRGLELLRQRDQDFRAGRNLQIATERTAELVLGTQATLFISTHAVRTATIELAVRRQRGGLADVHAIGHVATELQREAPEQRDIFHELVARHPVL